MQRVLENPNIPSKCITIPRSQDGRLQVSHRKGLPHLIYCRIYRWPDLQSPQELKAIDSCEFSFSSKQNEVCINPYHYERVDIPVLPPVLVPKHVEFSLGHSLVHNYSNQIYSSYNSSFSSNNSSYTSNTPNKSYNDKENYPQNQIHYSNYLNHSSPASVSINQFRNTINQNYYYYANNFNNSASYTSSSSPQSMLEESCENMSPLNSSNSLSPNRDTYFANQAPSNWCSISYYELNSRIGEMFHASTNDLFIDGYTNPCNTYGKRLCLGMFSNINRNASVENCRKHIGRGVHIYNDNGDIYVECLSDCAIFIQSRICNQERGFHPNTVCKLPSGYSLRIFQSALFAKQLNESIEKGYEAVYELANMCVIKISFVKGWGADYYRQDVSSCPCWIEIRLNGPFKWIDGVLKQLGSSTNPVSSVS